VGVDTAEKNWSVLAGGWADDQPARTHVAAAKVRGASRELHLSHPLSLSLLRQPQRTLLPADADDARGDAVAMTTDHVIPSLLQRLRRMRVTDSAGRA